MKRLLALGLLGVTLAGCGATGGPSATPGGGLEGTSWTLVELNGREPSADTPPTLAVDATGNVSGTTGCNTYNGTATIEGSSISFGPLATTRMACPGAAGVQETAYLGALSEVESFVIDSQGRLVLEGGAVLVFEPA